MIEGEKYDILSLTENNVPDITTILLEPCSSFAILSASSINNIPKPCKKTKLSIIVQKLDTLPQILLSTALNLTVCFKEDLFIDQNRPYSSLSAY